MPTPPPEIERRLGTVLAGRYKLERVLGVGGMGAVYEAEQALLGRRVAVKVMLTEAEPDSAAAQRFLQEARAAARIVHPNIVAVLDVGHDAMTRTFYIVHEHLTGEDLRARLGRGRLSPREALELLVPVLAALVAVHRRGIVHRDLKPENIFFAEADDGSVAPKLIDFGVSKVFDADGEPRSLTRTGQLVGTPRYMAPEQARGERHVDAAADVWAMGAVFYEALSGRCPFTADNYNALMLAILTEEPPRLDALEPAVPAALAGAVHAALTRDRAARPTAAAFLASLLGCPAFEGEAWHARLAAAYGAAASTSAPPPATAPTDDALRAPTREPDATPAPDVALRSTLRAGRAAPDAPATTSRWIVMGALGLAAAAGAGGVWRLTRRPSEPPHITATPEPAPPTVRPSEAPDAATAAGSPDAGLMDASAPDVPPPDRPSVVRRARPRPDAGGAARPAPSNGIPII